MDRPSSRYEDERLAAIEEAFRAGPPLTPDQQIGRGPSIDGLAQRLQQGEVKKLYEPRRVGKTSVARGALHLIREHGGVDAEVNLAVHRQPADAAGELAAKLAAGLVVPAAITSRMRWLTGRVAPTRADFGDEAGAIVAIAELLLGDYRDPARVLLNAAAHADRTLAVFLDEAHVIVEWPEAAKEALGAALRDVTRLGVVIASSERRALELLSGDGGPLQYVGDRFALPPIAEVDWRSELAARFARLGSPILPSALNSLLEVSMGQPYCTMLLARESAIAAMDADRCTETHVQAGLLAAQRDEAWRDLV